MRQAFCITLLKVIDAKSALSASKAEPTTPTTPEKYIIVNEHTHIPPKIILSLKYENILP